MTTQKPLRILIVDDQVSIREMLHLQLEKMGQSIIEKASNGPQIVKLERVRIF